MAKSVNGGGNGASHPPGNKPSSCADFIGQTTGGTPDLRLRLDALWNDQYGRVESDASVRNGCRIVGLQAKVTQMELIAGRTGATPQPIQFPSANSGDNPIERRRRELLDELARLGS